jgi:hypothetical protein
MKKAIFVLSVAALLSAGLTGTVSAQDQPKPKKDTVNIDTNAKPTFYYAEEEKEASRGNFATIAIVVGGVIAVGAAAFFLLKKKK